MTIQNFSTVQWNKEKGRPPHLVDFRTVSGYKVFKSSFDGTLYIFYDHVNEDYHIFNYTLPNFDTLQHDMEKLIEFLFIIKR